MGLGVALALSIGLNIYLVVREGDSKTRSAHSRDAPSDEDRPNEASASSTSHPAASRRRRARGTTTGTRAKPTLPSNPRERFQDQSRDADWAPRQEEVVYTRLEALLAELAKDISLQCRSSCCQMTDPKEVWPTMTADVQSSAGFWGWSTSSSFRWDKKQGEVVVICFDRNQNTFEAPFPTRATEQRKALAAAAPALKKCAASLTDPVRVGLSLFIDKSGNVARARLSGDHAGTKIARCVERAILTVANFAPAKSVSGLEFSVDLQPPQ